MSQDEAAPPAGLDHGVALTATGTGERFIIGHLQSCLLGKALAGLSGRRRVLGGTPHRVVTRKWASVNLHTGRAKKQSAHRADTEADAGAECMVRPAGRRGVLQPPRKEPR